MSTSRDDTIAEIRKALKGRSNKAWSVTGGRGTTWGWITIIAPPKRRDGYGAMTKEDCDDLAGLLGLEAVHSQGVSIPSGSAYYREYVDRANGRTPAVVGTPARLDWWR